MNLTVYLFNKDCIKNAYFFLYNFVKSRTKYDPNIEQV